MSTTSTKNIFKEEEVAPVAEPTEVKLISEKEMREAGNTQRSVPEITMNEITYR